MAEAELYFRFLKEEAKGLKNNSFTSKIGVMNEAIFKVYLQKINISNKITIKVSLEDIEISDHDLTVLKNIRPDARVIAIIKPSSELLSLADIEEERERIEQEKYKIL